MSLSVEQVRQMREQIKANDAAKTAAQKKTTTQTAKTTPAAATNTKNTGTGLSVAQVAQIRSQMTAAPASTSRLQTTPSTGGLRTGLELCWQRQRPETAGHCAGHLRQLRQGGAEGGKRPCQGPADRPL